MLARSAKVDGTPTGLDEMQCGLTLAIAPLDDRVAKDHDLCVRPESLDFLPATADPAPNRLPGRVVDVALLGAIRQIDVVLTGGQRVMLVQTNRLCSLTVDFHVTQSVNFHVPQSVNGEKGVHGMLRKGLLF